MHQFSTTFHTARLFLPEVSVPESGRIAPDLAELGMPQGDFPGVICFTVPVRLSLQPIEMVQRRYNGGFRIAVVEHMTTDFAPLVRATYRLRASSL